MNKKNTVLMMINLKIYKNNLIRQNKIKHNNHQKNLYSFKITKYLS